MPTMNNDTHANGGTQNVADTPAASSKQTLYEMLGVERSATADEISAAYKKLAKKHHPDRHSTKPAEVQEEQANLFKRVSHAHEILSDSAKRSQYDMFGEVDGAGAGDTAAQAMFEAMFMGGGGASAPKKRRMAGGALFVNAARQFFQRSWEVDEQTLQKMRDEMTQGLPDVKADGESFSTTLPHGVAWEVRVVETDATANTLTVTLCADADKEADGELEMRIERTFHLPTGADPEAFEVALDEANVLRATSARQSEAVPLGTSDDAASDATTVEMPTDAPSPTLSAEPEPMFVVGEDATAAALKASSNRAARRRAKHDGLKSGFLNAKPKRSKGGTVPSVARKENEPTQPFSGELPVPSVERQRACKSPVSVRDEIDAAMHAQVDELMMNA